MSSTAEMSNDTKERILKSAVNIFGAHSFRDATVAMICEAAQANVASVNYYFHSKEALFFEVIREAFRIANAAYPLDANLPTDASPALKLRGFMGALIRRSFDPGEPGHFNRILRHDANLPLSDRHKQVMKEVRALELVHLDTILMQLFPQANDRLLAQARMNIISLSAIFTILPMAGAAFFPEPPTPKALEAFIHRQHTFALGGLQALETAATH